MKSQDKKIDPQEKSKELLALSNQLFAVAKKLSEYHAIELKNGMAYAISYAKTAASQDMTQLKALQVAVSSEAAKRMVVYHHKVKGILDQMKGQSPDKHLKEARSALTAWCKVATKKLPQGAEQLSQVAHDVADTGMRAFKEGRKLVNEAADAAEKSLKKAAKKASKAKKATVKPKKVALKSKKVAVKPKKPGTKKPVVKNVLVKKASTRKSPAKTVSPSATPTPELPA